MNKMDIIFFCLLKKIMEIFSGLPAELQSLIYNEYYRGGKRVGNKWIFPLDKERIERFQELYNKRVELSKGYMFVFIKIKGSVHNKFYHIEYNSSEKYIHTPLL
jgi:hypothetical protein